MSKPQNKQNLPAMPGQIKTMFVVEGNPKAVVVTDVPGRAMFSEPYWFTDSSYALEWCRRNRCNFVYTPEAPNN